MNEKIKNYRLVVIKNYDNLMKKFPELEFSYHWYDWDGNPSGPAFGYYNYIDPKIF